MANYKGKIAKVFPSRFGGGSFGLEGQQGLYFNTKQPLPAFAVQGAIIDFEATPGRNGKSVFVNDASIREVSAPAPLPSGGGGGGSGISTDTSIRYQSSRKDAIAVVGVLVAAGAISLDKVPVAKRQGIIEDLVDRFTAVYFEDIETLGALERNPPVEPEAAKPAAADALPE
jgi:hypothetical protein